MYKKFFGALILIVVVALGTGSFFTIKKILTPKKIHYHAGVVVFQNNKKLNFSKLKYMSLEPCVLNKKEEDSAEDIQIEKAHLHDNVGDVVHVERTGAIWRDLFTNIHFPLFPGLRLKFRVLLLLCSQRLIQPLRFVHLSRDLNHK